MIIETGDLREKDRRYTGAEPFSILEIGHDQFVRGGSSVKYNLRAQRLNDELLVLGTLTVELECQCARCMEWFRKPIRVAGFVRNFTLLSENESIDLTGDIREDILLALPINLVCSAGCRGLCPMCGENLNKRKCACRPRGGSDAWNVLDQLKLK
jgi:uncharacterized protein